LFIYVLPLEIQLYRRDCWDPINVCLYMFSRWRSSYIEDGWDPINVCLYMFCRWRSSYIEDGWDPINVCLYMFSHWRSSYIEGKVGIPLTFVYICFVGGYLVI
jgi:hypothetical protein